MLIPGISTTLPAKQVNAIPKRSHCAARFTSEKAFGYLTMLSKSINGGYQLHSQTVQATCQSYFAALKSYFAVVKVNPDAKPPKRTPKYFKVHWKSSAITYRDGIVRLSNGKDRKPVFIKAPQKPVCVEMYFHRGNYYFSLVYKVEPPPREITGNVVAVDMGEIHPILLTLT